MAMESLDASEFAAVRYEGSDGTQIVALKGEVDLSSARQLRDLTRRAKASIDPPCVAVDLSGLEFIDTAGLAVLLEERNSSWQLGGRMVLVAPQEGPVRRLL